MKSFIKQVLLSILILPVTHSCFSQVTFQKLYSYTGNPHTEGVATGDSGFVFTGVIGSGITRPCLIKLNSVGDTLWTKRYMSSTSGLAIETSLLQTIDGGFIVTSPEIIKTDANGNLLWARGFQNTNWFGEDAVESANGDICAVGYSQISGSDKISVVKLDSSGNMLSSAYFGATGDEPHSIRRTLTGGYIIAGTSEISGTDRDGLLVLLNDSGNVQWSNVYNYAGDEEFNKVLSLADGSFLVMGTSTILPTGNTGIILVKIDSVGAVIWSLLYQEISTYGYGLYETPDGRFLITGTSDSPGSNQQSMIANIDSVGNVLWYKKYNPLPGQSDAVFSSVAPAIDGGYLLTGSSIGSSGFWFYVAKTDSSLDNLNFCAQNVGLLPAQPIPLTKVNYPLSPSAGTLIFPALFTTSVDVQTTTICSSVGIDEPNFNNVFEIYPNPVQDILFLKTTFNENPEVVIYDITGKEVSRKTVTTPGEINVSCLSPGMYVVNLSGIRRQVFKIVK